MYKLYCLAETDTGRVFYIGITKRTLKERLQSHSWSSMTKKGIKWKSTTPKSKHIRHLRTKKIAFEIVGLLESAEKSNIEAAERQYISFAKRLGFNLTNSTSGGQGMLDYQHKPETIKRLRRLNSGKGNPNWNKSPSEETRAKQRKALKGKPRPRPKDYEGWRRRISENHADVSGANNPMYNKPSPTRKKIAQYTLEGVKIAEYPSATAAARAIGLSRVTVSNCASGRSPSAGGFKWIYDAS